MVPILKDHYDKKMLEHRDYLQRQALGKTKKQGPSRK